MNVLIPREGRAKAGVSRVTKGAVLIRLKKHSSGCCINNCQVTAGREARNEGERIELHQTCVTGIVKEDGTLVERIAGKAVLETGGIGPIAQKAGRAGLD